MFRVWEEEPALRRKSASPPRAAFSCPMDIAERIWQLVLNCMSLSPFFPDQHMEVFMWEYTDTVREHFLHPKNVGELKDANAVG